MGSALSSLQFILGLSLNMAIPLLLAALGEIFVQRSGCINMGIEGMMLIGSFIGVVATIYYGVSAGFLLCIAAGILLGLFMAFMSVNVKASQPIVGVVLNLLGAGATSFLYRYIIGLSQDLPTITQLSNIQIPLLSKLPVIGFLFNQNLLTYAVLLLVPLSHVVIFRSNFGLSLRAVGGNAEAADTMGISVAGIRYACWVIGATFATLSGLYLAFNVGLFADGMSASRGFIALALVLFARWKPINALYGALLFGLADSVQIWLQALNVNIPYQLLVMFPYILTILIMAVAARLRFVNPSLIGVPYSRESKDHQ